MSLCYNKTVYILCMSTRQLYAVVALYGIRKGDPIWLQPTVLITYPYIKAVPQVTVMKLYQQSIDHP